MEEFTCSGSLGIKRKSIGSVNRIEQKIDNASKRVRTTSSPKLNQQDITSSVISSIYQLVESCNNTINLDPVYFDSNFPASTVGTSSNIDVSTDSSSSPSGTTSSFICLGNSSSNNSTALFDYCQATTLYKDNVSPHGNVSSDGITTTVSLGSGDLGQEPATHQLILDPFTSSDQEFWQRNSSLQNLELSTSQPHQTAYDMLRIYQNTELNTSNTFEEFYKNGAISQADDVKKNKSSQYTTSGIIQHSLGGIQTTHNNPSSFWSSNQASISNFWANQTTTNYNSTSPNFQDFNLLNSVNLKKSKSSTKSHKSSVAPNSSEMDMRFAPNGNSNLLIDSNTPEGLDLTPIPNSTIAVNSMNNKSGRVFIWDLDETLILFNSLITGSYTRNFPSNQELVIKTGIAIEEFLYAFVDSKFFYNDLDACQQVHIDDVSQDDNGIDLSTYDFESDGFASATNTTNSSNIVQMPLCINSNFNGPSAQFEGTIPSNTGCQNIRGTAEWMKKMAYRYRRIRELYNQYKNCPEGILTKEQHIRLLSLIDQIDQLTSRWHEFSKAVLAIIYNRCPQNSVNVLVSSSHLIVTLGKLLIYQIAPYFEVENVYSSQKSGVGKTACFERIASRFGSKAIYVVIGDSEEDEQGAKEMNWPFWRVKSHSDLCILQHVLQEGFL